MDKSSQRGENLLASTQTPSKTFTFYTQNLETLKGLRTDNSLKVKTRSPENEETVLKNLWIEVGHLQNDLKNSYSAWLCSLVTKILRTTNTFSTLDQIITLGMLLDVDGLSVKQLEKNFEDILRSTLEFKHEYELENTVDDTNSSLDWRTEISINQPITVSPNQRPS